ncbi:MAG: DNA polymerase III subunit gamma/tau [Leeuwenhoekiella sp.]
MEHFIVSARKYRPTTFEDVVGQQAITNTLENAIADNHLAQALLFTGPRGVGKTTCARILAKKINQQAEGTPADEDYAFNIFELDAASNNSVDDIRNLIDQVRIQPQVGKYKVYIIDEVHMLSQAAFNAFLKTLEEPPKHAIFILATTEKHKIIPTILSRCQIFDFKRITVGDIRDHLAKIAKQEGVDADEEGLQIIAQKADGALRDALSTYDRVVSFAGKQLTRKAVTENLNVLDYDTFFKVTHYIQNNNIPQLLVYFNSLLAQGFDGHHFISGLASHFRDLMVCKHQETIQLLEVGDQTKAKYNKQAQMVEMPFLLRALDMANDCDLKYRNSRNPRLLVELCLMQLASITFDGEKKKDKNYIIPPSHFKEEALPVEINATKSAGNHLASAEKQTEGTPAEIKSDKVSTESNTTNEKQLKQAVSSEAHAIQKNKVTTVKPSVEKTATAPESSQKAPATAPEKSTIKESPAAQPSALAPQRIDLKRAPVSGLSLSGLKRKKEIEQQKNAAQLDDTNLPRKPFTETAMQAAWQDYIKKLIKTGKKIMASNLSTDTPKLDRTTINLTFPNDTMRVELEREQHGLLEYLKRKLQNYDVTIAVTVNEETAKKFAYTAREKFDKLNEKNPNLDLLRKTFDLDL